MKRQQIFDRNYYDLDDRIEIMKKTGNVCAHCGAKLHYGSNMRVDHCVPLSKGGINQKLNAVPLCDACNDRKRNKIVSPEWYMPYLKEEPKKALMDYFNSYIKSFEYISRGNLLACDMYQMSIYAGPRLQIKDEKKRRELMKRAEKKYILERAYTDELGEVTAFYIEYLKKYSYLKSEDAAAKNVEFWDKFGVIYVIRDKSGIRAMLPITVGTDWEGKYYLGVKMMSLYTTDLSKRLISKIPDFFAERILEEQNLPYIRVMASILPVDNAGNYLPQVHAGAIARMGDGFAGACYMYDPTRQGKYDDDFPFYDRFHDVKLHMDRFFARDGYDGMRFLGNGILFKYEELHAEEEANEQSAG